jgi:hypothetical protein
MPSRVLLHLKYIWTFSNYNYTWRACHENYFSLYKPHIYSIDNEVNAWIAVLYGVSCKYHGTGTLAI